MRRISCFSIVLLGATMVSAQGVTDVLRYSKNDIVGTARYMGMAGAFGALGGDISTLSQNPAGIGIYRSSEVVATLDLGGVETKSEVPTNNLSITGPALKNGKFNIGCNNLGYIGTFMTGKRSGLINFNVGFAFNRQAGQKRRYQVTQNEMKNGLSDYIADRTNIWASNTPNSSPDDLSIPEDISKYDPYFQSSAPWISILGYNAYVINPVSSEAGNYYAGLYPDEAVGIGGDLTVNEKYRIDEYTFNVGGNFSNMVYWGLGIGISDLNFETRTQYDEYYWKAGEPQTSGNYQNFQLNNYLNTSGTGVNIKFGLIARPTSALRLGAAVHTPTWYKMTDSYGADMQSFNVPELQNRNSDRINTPADAWDYKMRTPWKFQVGAAYVIGKAGLVSFDYERADYSYIHLEDEDGYADSFAGTNNDIKNQLKGINTFRVGTEIRLSTVTSLRLGYANQSSAYTDPVKDNKSDIYAAGTVPNYVIDRGTQYFTGGLGYRLGSVFMDMAFVWKENRQDAYMFPNVEGYVTSERNRLTTSSYKFLVTVGYKF
ncbi:MAG: hypothetical protein RR212_06525 [Bacteroidales bacterium]